LFSALFKKEETLRVLLKPYYVYLFILIGMARVPHPEAPTPNVKENIKQNNKVIF